MATGISDYAMAQPAKQGQKLTVPLALDDLLFMIGIDSCFGKSPSLFFISFACFRRPFPLECGAAEGDRL